jgi:hypothetical protein
MREDHLEMLDKAFPQGYVIVYTCPDGQIRMSYYNPDRLEQIYAYYDYLTDLKEGE